MTKVRDSRPAVQQQQEHQANDLKPLAFMTDSGSYNSFDAADGLLLEENLPLVPSYITALSSEAVPVASAVPAAVPAAIPAGVPAGVPAGAPAGVPAAVLAPVAAVTVPAALPAGVVGPSAGPGAKEDVVYLWKEIAEDKKFAKPAPEVGERSMELAAGEEAADDGSPMVEEQVRSMLSESLFVESAMYTGSPAEEVGFGPDTHGGSLRKRVHNEPARVFLAGANDPAPGDAFGVAEVAGSTAGGGSTAAAASWATAAPALAVGGASEGPLEVDTGDEDHLYRPVCEKQR